MLLSIAFGLVLLSGCSTAAQKSKLPQALDPVVPPQDAPDPAPVAPPPDVFIRGGTVMTAAGVTHSPGHLLLSKGKIALVGAGDREAPPGAQVIDATGRFVTPGLIDSHSHLGVYPMPSVDAHQDGNEASNPVTAQVWAEHSFWPQDPGLWRALAGGVTAMQVLPGSANLIGGRSFVAKLRRDRSARAMRFPGAPQGLKMACGENPKRVYGAKQRDPTSRMANVAGYRSAFQKAAEYRRALVKYERDLTVWRERRDRGDAAKEPDKPFDPPEPPVRDLMLETLALVLDGKILVHCHCYRADEMSLMLDLAKEFGFRIRSFHHSLEAYKIRDRLAAEDVSVSTWADWWGFKLEAYDGVPQNASMVTRAGARAIIHSDSARDIRRLNQEAAKARTAGARVGFEVSEDEALKWVTLNPAWALGVDDRTGSLAPGKMADVVIWSAHPFSVYALAEKVFVDGALVYDRPARKAPLSDFELGLMDPGAVP